MAICSALTGAIAKSCDTNTGGVRKIWLADWSQLSYTRNGSGQITSFNNNNNYFIAAGNATWNTTNVGGGTYVLTTVVFPGDATPLLQPGDKVSATYFDSLGNNYSITFSIISATFAGGNTTITPDWTAYGFQPIVSTTVPLIIQNQNVFIGNPFFEFAFNRNTSSFEENAMINLENQSTYYDQKVNLMLQRRETSKREAIESLIAGQKQLLAIVLDSNGLYWLLGSDSGLYATEITGGSGVTKSDKNGYAIVLTAEEAIQALEVTANALSLFLINA